MGPWLNKGRFSDATLSGPGWLDQLLAADPAIQCVLVDFFAYSCTNCVRTIAGMQQLHESYGPGLLVVALHRPEFDFEKDPANLAHFLRKKGVTYLVAMDNDDAAWSAWDVSMWPTHYLVERDRNAPSDAPRPRKVYHQGVPALFVGDSVANHATLEHLACKLTGTTLPATLLGLTGPEEAEPPRALDMEVFLGKLHQYKNVDSGSSCGEGACVVQRPVGIVKASLSAEAMPAAVGITIYGAAWCRFCRAAKMLLDELGISYRYVDVEAAGGPAAVIAALGVSQQTIPLVYGRAEMGQPPDQPPEQPPTLLGGFDDLCAELGRSEAAAGEDKPRRKSLLGKMLSPRPRGGDSPKGGGAAAAGRLGSEEHAALVARCVEAARSSELRFERRGDTAKVALGHGWGVQDERAIARAEGATIEVEFAFGKGGQEPMTVYVVGGPDVRGEPGGASFSAALPGGGPEAVATPVADRHYAATVPNGGKLSLRFAEGFCVYVVYLTSEPADEIDLDEVRI